MKIIDVPVFNEDGSVKFTQVLTAAEAQVLLQFALNFLASTGLSVKVMVDRAKQDEQQNGTPDITIN
jgi:hypothetical protein